VDDLLARVGMRPACRRRRLDLAAAAGLLADLAVGRCRIDRVPVAGDDADGVSRSRSLSE
jgi:hypothetical protein